MIIRAYELKRGDIFKKQGYAYLVVQKTERDIIYRNYYAHDERIMGTIGIMGAYSQERIEHIGTKPKKKLTKPIKEVYESNVN